MLLNYLSDALMLALELSIPVAIAAAGAALLMGIFQSATRLEDQTISTVPRLIAIYGVIAALGFAALRMVAQLGMSLWEHLASVQQ